MFWNLFCPKFICKCFVTLLLILSSIISVSAGSKQAEADFDHLTTGFFLSPAHRNVDCADCHVKGIFKSTPKECGQCHSSSTVITALGKSRGHPYSTDDCEECHGDNG